MAMMMMEDEGQGSAVGSYCDGLFFGAFTFVVFVFYLVASSKPSAWLRQLSRLYLAALAQSTLM